MAENQDYTFVPKGSPQAKTPAQQAGGTTFVPRQAGQASPAGGSQAEMDRAAQPWHTLQAGAGFQPSNLLSNLYEGGKSAVKGVYNLGSDIVNNPNWVTGPDSTLHKFVIAPAEEQKMKAVTAPTAAESIGHSVAEAIPFIGPWAANLGEQAGQGDVGGALAKGAGTVAGLKGVGTVARLATPSLNFTTGETSVKPVIGSLKATVEPPPAATFLRGMVRDIPGIKGGLKAIDEAEQAKADYAAAKRTEDLRAQGLPEHEIRYTDQVQLPNGTIVNRGVSPLPRPTGGMPPVKSLEDVGIKQTPEGKLVGQNVYSEGMAGQRTPVRGVTVTPKEVASVKEAGAPAAERTPTQAEVDQAAAEETAKMQAGKPKLSETEQHGFEHRIGKENTDLLNDEGGVNLARQLLKGTNKEYIDTGRYLGVKGSGRNGDITPDDLSRAGRGKDLSPIKAQVIKAIRESENPHDLIGHWGQK